MSLSKSGTTLEYFITECSNRIRNSNSGDSLAVFKCIITDYGKGIAKGKLDHALATVECAVADLCNICISEKRCLKRLASVKCKLRNFCNSLTNINLLERFTTIKSVASHAGYGIRNLYVFKRSTTCKSVMLDIGNAIREINLGNSRLLECIGSYTYYLNAFILCGDDDDSICALADSGYEITFNTACLLLLKNKALTCFSLFSLICKLGVETCIFIIGAGNIFLVARSKCKHAHKHESYCEYFDPKVLFHNFVSL